MRFLVGALGRHLGCSKTWVTPVGAIRRCATKPTEEVRVRFAPSPTGFLHLGGMRTALYNHLLARKTGGKWLLRIEDTDQERLVPGAVTNLIKILKSLGLDYDEGPDKPSDVGPFIQSERKELYSKYIEQLIEEGKAYHCFCSEVRVNEVKRRLKSIGAHTTYDRLCLGIPLEDARKRVAEGERHVVRFKSDTNGLVAKDLVYDDIKYDRLAYDDFVLKKGDGLPTYHLASVVDDHHMKISHVLRGDEWIPSVPKHLRLYEALGWEPPKFAHLPILMTQKKKKLSKRSEDVRVEHYLKLGYEPEALLNFVLFLGWAPSDFDAGGSRNLQSDVMTLPQMIDAFSIKDINTSRSTVNLVKLEYLNKSHLRMKLNSPEGIADLARRALSAMSQEKDYREKFYKRGEPDPLADEAEEVDEAPGLDLEYVKRIVQGLGPQLNVLNDIVPLARPFFFAPKLNTSVSKSMFLSTARSRHRQVVFNLQDILKELPDSAFDEVHPRNDIIADKLAKLIGKPHIPNLSSLFASIRHILTETKVGASIPATIRILGRDECLSRLDYALEVIRLAAPNK